MLKLSLTWHMIFFNDFHWFSMTFPGKMPFFQVNIKFHDFSSQGLNSMTVPGLCEPCYMYRQTNTHFVLNKANLRDLIVATGLEILLKFDPNHRFSARVTLKFDGWHRKILGHISYTKSSFVHHIKSFGEFKLKLQSGNAQFGSKLAGFFVPRGEIWWMTLENNRASLLYFIKLCASFQNHGWIQTGATVRKRLIRVKIGNFCPVWPWNLMDDLNNRTPLLY